MLCFDDTGSGPNKLFNSSCKLSVSRAGSVSIASVLKQPIEQAEVTPCEEVLHTTWTHVPDEMVIQKLQYIQSYAFTLVSTRQQRAVALRRPGSEIRACLSSFLGSESLYQSPQKSATPPRTRVLVPH